MKLMTKEIEKAFAKFPLHSQEGKGDAALVVAKFFDPTGRYTFYATEGQWETDDEPAEFQMFGYCVSPVGPDCDEWGYALLSEMERVRLPFGLGIERDRLIAPATKTVPGLVGHRTLPVVCDSCGENDAISGEDRCSACIDAPLGPDPGRERFGGVA